MANDDKQAAVLFSLQEGLLELEEQVLEEITGAGLFSRIFGGGAKTASTANKPAGAVSYDAAKQLNPLYKQAGLSERYRPGSDSNFHLKE
jgi:hypothetical protein